MHLLKKDTEIKKFCLHASNEKFVAVDTEFMRTKTYWPKLCLIQIATSKKAVVIDALTDNKHLEPIKKLLINPKILKVFHGARQDLEVIYHVFGKPVKSIFDTQVAAMVCGFDHPISYAKLVSKLIKIKINKKERSSDWSLRPLTKQQIKYALSDVVYLKKIYKILLKMLEKNKRLNWIKDEMQNLQKKEHYITEPKTIWKKIKFSNKPSDQINIIKRLAEYRELEAQGQDLPRSWLLTDREILQIARIKPKTEEAIRKEWLISKQNMKKNDLQKIISIVKLKNKNVRSKKGVGRSSGNSETNESIRGMLMLLLKLKCKEYGVAEKMIATNDQVQDIASGHRSKVPALSGWRKEIFGNDAIRLRKGEISLKIKRGKIILAQ
jgi:ribonuclease D|tara:strand:+ start:3896 stop:5038 length:1143 start_codon:yes stop_codon:yes gene_type:complete